MSRAASRRFTAAASGRPGALRGRPSRAPRPRRSGRRRRGGRSPGSRARGPPARPAARARSPRGRRAGAAGAGRSRAGWPASGPGSSGRRPARGTPRAHLQPAGAGRSRRARPASARDPAGERVEVLRLRAGDVGDDEMGFGMPMPIIGAPTPPGDGQRQRGQRSAGRAGARAPGRGTSCAGRRSPRRRRGGPRRGARAPRRRPPRGRPGRRPAPATATSRSGAYLRADQQVRLGQVERLVGEHRGEPRARGVAHRSSPASASISADRTSAWTTLRDGGRLGRVAGRVARAGERRRRGRRRRRQPAGVAGGLRQEGPGHGVAAHEAHLALRKGGRQPHELGVHGPPPSSTAAALPPSTAAT